MENWKEIFASFGLWSLVEDISDDGDGKGDNLQLTKDGELFVSEIQQELDKAREEGRREGFIFGYGKGEHSMSEFLEHKWDIPHSSRMSAIPDEEIDKALESLTKLTTK